MNRFSVKSGRGGFRTAWIWVFGCLAWTGGVIAAGGDAGAAAASNPWTKIPFGWRLPKTNNLELWWCESAWKVLREHPLPASDSESESRPVRLALARGEYESAQIILRPERETILLSAGMAPMRNQAGGDASSIHVELSEVAYLEVTRPTDKSCEAGWYPDPLPRLRPPLRLEARRNQPIWMTARVSREARAGEYVSELTLETSEGTARVPVQFRVFDFELPRETHLKSAFGLGTANLNRYHRLVDPRDKEAVFEEYLQNFAEHRVSPYSFFDHAPIQIRFTGEGAEKKARLDFTAFDRAAAKWLDEHHFTTFQLPLRGMGGGTFHSRHPGELEGFKEGTPEHARLFHDYLSQIEAHLRAKGWLNKAYTYWFDEPDRKDYRFVVEGMKRLKEAAPGIKRMLTEQPEPELLGHVEIWCGLTPEWTPEKVRARTALGEEVWWYICTGPKSPYITLFIDHPGIELRLWPWQSWQYGVTGILVWATTYWNSPAAFPAPKRQDPWSDPMAYVSGYDFKPGQVGYWGNGDGRFLYPPRSSTAVEGPPILEGPVNSIRWENLRDGIEDYEFLWLLRQHVERLQKLGLKSERLRQAQELLRVPEEISRDLTHFTIDPRPLLARREEVARMIEALKP